MPIKVKYLLVLSHNMAEDLYILRHPLYEHIDGEKVISTRGRYEYIALADRIKGEIGPKVPCILSSPAPESHEGAELLRKFLGGTIEYFPILLTGKAGSASLIYSTRTPEILEKKTQQMQLPTFGPQYNELEDQVLTLLTQELREWVDTEKLFPMIDGIQVPFSRLSNYHTEMDSDWEKVTGLSVPVGLGLDHETEGSRHLP
jgi:hypothetical protein